MSVKEVASCSSIAKSSTENKLHINASLSDVSVGLSSGDIASSISVANLAVPNAADANCSQAEIVHSVNCNELVSSPVVTSNLFGTGIKHGEKSEDATLPQSSVSGCIEVERY